MKTCKICKETKNYSQFYRVEKNGDGYHKMCRMCANEYHKKYSFRIRENLKPIECSLPECNIYFQPRKSTTLFCCSNHKTLGNKQGITEPKSKTRLKKDIRIENEGFFDRDSVCELV